MLLTIFIEYISGLPVYQQMLNKFVIKLPIEPPSVTKDIGTGLISSTPTHAGAIALDPNASVASVSTPVSPTGAWSDMKDIDVKQEEERVRHQVASRNSTDTIIVSDTHKVYYNGNKHAVKGVTLGIPNGECFGLLGINGAGKTSLLSMLSGEIAPTVGDITLNGLSMSTQSHQCRKHIGFCPQFDALFELLTAREHLALYARLKGIAERDIETVVNDKITEMGLTEYQNRLAGTYSGGNKRKLSVAIAMIGEPSIVFLDEPSTGMDPAARRFMWDIISDIVTKREKCCLILTTHSMEEAEALCTRVGIMVGGVIRCIGSTQHLRTQYGKGYQIEFDMEIPTTDEVEAQCAAIVAIISENKNAFGAFSETTAKRPIDEITISNEHLSLLFDHAEHPDWSVRISETGTGCDLWSSQKQNNGLVTLKHLASWWLIEINYDKLCTFLTTNYDSYVLRERHTSRVRVEISSEHPITKSHIKLSAIFGAIESEKKGLGLDGYSVSQTSLEQIFNQFAAQQEEETGVVAGVQ
jgi:ATP-binding cassette, subfamily A (ABC1), member 3